MTVLDTCVPAPAVLHLPPVQYRAHAADGQKVPAHTESHACAAAGSLARATGGPVAVERWDLARQEWVLADLIGHRS